jgi:hypothetical protein
VFGISEIGFPIGEAEGHFFDLPADMERHHHNFGTDMIWQFCCQNIERMDAAF